MKFKKKYLVALAGLIWFAVGVLLLIKGIHLIISGSSVRLVLIALGLMLGFIKGRWILAKAAQKTIKRLSSLSEPIPLFKLYLLKDYLLIASMIFLGVIMRWTELHSAIYGFVDVAVGSALINGAMVYFRYLLYGDPFSISTER